MRLAFCVSYLGSRFFGSQMQESSRTVEGEFIATCRRLELFSDWRNAGFLSSGRTDRGVHARGQVIAFSTEHPDRARTALNYRLPPDIWCTGVAEVPEEFHPRYDARSRTYRYFFSDAPDCQKINEAARHFLGEHNFSRFARVGDKNPWRDILAIRAGKDEGFVYLEVTARSFLWHQVRCMASAVLRVARGEEEAAWIDALLRQEPDKPVQPAPAEGLVLWETDCGISFEPVPVPDRSVTYREELRRHHALMEQVCCVLRPEPGSEDERRL